MRLVTLPLVVLLALVSWASGQTTSGQWTYMDSGTTITASTANGAVTIPSVLGGYAVKRVAEGIFGYGNTSVTSVVIPNSVTSINGAFENCTGLTSAGIPDSVTTIGVSAFRDCTGLTNVSIPDSVTSIEFAAFFGCPNLKEVNIPLRFLSVLAQIFDPEVASRLMIQLQEEANPPWWKRILRIFQPQPT